MSISKQAEQIREISGVNPYKCMKCGKCSASCPSFNEMDIKPHQFVSYVLNDDIESLVNSKSLWKCLSCFACIERCRETLSPASLSMRQDSLSCASAVKHTLRRTRSRSFWIRICPSSSL